MSFDSNLLNNLNTRNSQALLVYVAVMLSLFIGNSSNIQSSVLTIEELRDFLERSITGFDEEEVDDTDFEGEEDAVADVVLPLECFEGDGVDVLVWKVC
jgi:hypothetical protein